MSIKLRGSGPIAIVDDQEAILHLAKVVFKKSDLDNELRTFSSGEHFLEYMQDTKSKANPLPEVVLLDLNMPVMNGFDVLETLRSDEAFRDNPLVVVFTASADPDDRQRALALGANAFQTKFMEVECFIEFANSLCP